MRQSFLKLTAAMVLALPGLVLGQDVPAEQPFPGGGLKEEISVRVNKVNELIKKVPAGKNIVLFLDGQEMTNIFGTLREQPGPSGVGVLRFVLDRDSENRDAWRRFLTRPTLEPRVVPLSVGVQGGEAIPTEWNNFRLKVVHPDWLAGWAVAFVVFGILFVWKARTTPLLREPGLEGAQAAFSLARVQMAWWFFLVLASFLFLFMVTWDYNTIAAGTLGLIGISAGTALSAAVVDSSKRDQLTAEKTTLLNEQASEPAPAPFRQKQIPDRLAAIEKELMVPRHVDFLSDILGDSNGTSFHRMQMFVWTIVLGVIFLISVYNDLSMPAFSATLLGLMGISAGTYVGFKFPETKN